MFLYAVFICHFTLVATLWQFIVFYIANPSVNAQGGQLAAGVLQVDRLIQSVGTPNPTVNA